MVFVYWRVRNKEMNEQSKFKIPENHPRASSLYFREKIVDGLNKGIVAPEGLIAHGRGESFDYLLGENTTSAAYSSTEAAVCAILLSVHPVFSINGNVAALCSDDIVELSNLVNAKIEINLFYRTAERERNIKELLIQSGAKEIYGINPKNFHQIPELSSERRHVDVDGIAKADLVLVPLEDGDRTESLMRLGKQVIAIDLNPLSRTSQYATITIVDNVIRTIPLMIKIAKKLTNVDKNTLKEKLSKYDNKKNLDESIKIIRSGYK